MNRKKLVPLAFAVILATGTAAGAGLAHAGESERSDAAALANAKVTLSQAIATAEQQSGGNAISAGLENQNGIVSISVDVARKQGAETVLVNPQTGQVVTIKPADDGHDGEAE